MSDPDQELQLPQFQEILGRGTQGLEVSLTDESIPLLYRYFVELKHWSRRVNLVSKESSDSAIVENHFIDSLALLTVLGRHPPLLLDVGSGAGFPGLVCKAARHDLPVCLLEPRLKRVSFLNHIVRTLGLDKISVLALRLEEGLELPDEMNYTCVVSRAVTRIGGFLSLCSRWRRPGCRVICMKGPRYTEEIREAGAAMSGWELTEVKTYRLPFSRASRALLVFRGRDNGR